MIYWFEESFFPYLRNLRILYNYQGPAVIILDGYKSHENCLNSLDLESQNLIIHYLEPHSSEQTQPLDISIFGAMKRYNSNYKMKSDLSYITNQILKIQGSLFCVCNPIICHSAFRAIGIIPIRYSENPYVEIAGFDVRFCSKVRGYQISQIEYQIQNNIPLTPNQMFIYDQHKKNKNKNQKNSFRIEIPSFETL
ncbi:hypothetical protein M9Y10_014064 [Tritrichomonas musculus]|uniref:DDE-1 domain-containing protein n=1 Tax=Tritrichomonas musculus TaxID=1915356 RepID=A0ABR2KYH1_9EUKA